MKKALDKDPQSLGLDYPIRHIPQREEEALKSKKEAIISALNKAKGTSK